MCCPPDTHQQEPEQSGPREFVRGPGFQGRDPHDCVPAPVFSPCCFLFPFQFPSLKPLAPCAGAGPWVAIKHTGSFSIAECEEPLMCPGAATLHPPAFQRQVPGHCVHILSLFVHLLGGPAPQPPCHSRSRPDPQIKAARLMGQSCYQSRGKRHRLRCSCQDRELSRVKPAGVKAPGQQPSPRDRHRPRLLPRGTGAVGRSGISAMHAKGCPCAAALPLGCIWGGPASCQKR